MKRKKFLACNNSIVRYWTAENELEAKEKGESIIEIITPYDVEERSDSSRNSDLEWQRLSLIDYCVTQYNKYRHNNKLILFLMEKSIQDYFDLFDQSVGTFDRDYDDAPGMMFWFLNGKSLENIPEMFRKYVKGTGLSFVSFSEDKCYFYSNDGEEEDAVLIDTPVFFDLSMLKLIAIRLGWYFITYGYDIFYCKTDIYRDMCDRNDYRSRLVYGRSLYDE